MCLGGALCAKSVHARHAAGVARGERVEPRRVGVFEDARHARELLARVGRDVARDVCAKNPGVLSCNPKALRTSTANEITRAADGVEFIESLPIFRIPLLRNNLDKIIFFAGASVVAKRLLVDHLAAPASSPAPSWPGAPTSRSS